MMARHGKQKKAEFTRDSWTMSVVKWVIDVLTKIIIGYIINHLDNQS